MELYRLAVTRSISGGPECWALYRQRIRLRGEQSSILTLFEKFCDSRESRIGTFWYPLPYCGIRIGKKAKTSRMKQQRRQHQCCWGRRRDLRAQRKRNLAQDGGSKKVLELSHPNIFGIKAINSLMGPGTIAKTPISKQDALYICFDPFITIFQTKLAISIFSIYL